MVDLETIEREINELEAHYDTSYRVCERLAWLYICRDHLKPPVEKPATVSGLSGSEFLDECDGTSYPMLMRVLDEHMSALRIVQPREYEAVMAKIRALK